MKEIPTAQFYEEMFLIRTIENKFLYCYSQGLIKGTVHTCLGQEACAVGFINALNKDIDIIFSNHRAHGHILAYGVPPQYLIAEILGCKNGLCAGIGGTQHLQWKNFYTNGIQGGMTPSAVGSALAEKLKKSGAVSCVFIGDGTMGQGVVYESFNISSLWNLPIIFILENNQYAQSTPVFLAHSGKLEDRARPFAIKTYIENGNDVEKIFNTANEIISYVRTNCKPAFLVLNTYRLGPHSKGDDYRDKKEIEKNAQNDPIKLFAGKISHSERKKIEDSVIDSVKEILGNKE